MDAMLRFLYNQSYDERMVVQQKDKVETGIDNGAASGLVFHIRVYAIADKYLLPALMKTAVAKFTIAA